MANADGYQNKMNEFRRELERMSSEIPEIPTQQEILRDLHALQQDWEFKYNAAQVGLVEAVTMEDMYAVIENYGLDPERYAVELPGGAETTEGEMATGEVYLPDMQKATLRIGIGGKLETVLDVYAYFISGNRRYTVGGIMLTQEDTGEEWLLGDVGDRVQGERNDGGQWTIAFDVEYYSYKGSLEEDAS